MRLINADKFCAFLREVSTRQHYERLLTKKDKYPTVADVIEEICCDLDGTSLKGFDNAPTVEIPNDILKAYYLGYAQSQVDLERPKSEWIPVSQRLPEDAFGCLVTIYATDSYTQEDYEYVLPYAVGYDGETWNDCQGDEIPYEVLAWQPLPEPYKEACADAISEVEKEANEND